MSQPPNKITQFWQELKRRKVIKVIAMYAGAAYVLIELANNVVEPLNLPDWTPRLVIIIALIGFPIIVVLSWIFDITPEGLSKTEAIEELKEQEAKSIHAKRRIKLSDVIIGVLFAAVCILLYPKIFSTDKFEDIRDADGKISIVVMPFQNVTGDTLYEGMELGLQNLLITRLSNSDELVVRQTQTIYDLLSNNSSQNFASITPSVAGDIAFDLDANTVIIGNLHKSGNNLRITANLMDPRNKEIYKSFEIDGDSEADFFSITDSLIRQIKNHFEIRVLEQDIDKEIYSFGISGSAEAYRYLSKGNKKYWVGDYEAALDYFKTALEIDTNIFAISWSLIPTYMMLGKHEEARQLIDKLYKNIDQYTILEQALLEMQKSRYDKNPQEIIKHIKLALEENPMFRAMWSQLGQEYISLKRYWDAIPACEKALEIDRKLGGGWEEVWFYVNCGIAYHNTGQHSREEEIYELGLEILPDHPTIIAHQAVCALSRGDTTAANNYIAKYRSIMEPEDTGEDDINFQIGLIYYEADFYEMAEKFLRQANETNPQNASVMNELAYLLIDRDININEGMELINKALEIEPDNANFMDTKGWGLHKQGRDSEALELLNKAWSDSPFYNHFIFLHIQEVEQALASQNQ